LFFILNVDNLFIYKYSGDKEIDVGILNLNKGKLGPFTGYRYLFISLMFKKKAYIFTLFLFLVQTGILQAQSTTPSRDKEVTKETSWILGASIGPDFFFGDLTPDKLGTSKNVNFAGTIFAGRQFSHIFGLRAEFLFGGVKGSRPVTEGGTTINQLFSGFMINFDVNATVNFSNLLSPYKPTRKFFIYGTLGFGVAGWNTKRSQETTSEIIPIDTIGRWRAGVIIPFGLGAYYRITKQINAGIEWTFRPVMSDMVDQTGDGYKIDFVDYLSFGISINLGVREKKSMHVREYPYPMVPAPQPLPYTPNPLPVLEPESRPMEVVYTPPPAGADYVYAVQIFAFSKRDYSTETIRKRYHITQPVIKENEGILHRYIIGNYKDIGYARELRDQMIKKGIHDAFIVAYKNGIRDHVANY